MEALGQAFFSLSLGTACLCTYASVSEGKKFLEKNGKLELVKKLKQMIAESYRPILEKSGFNRNSIPLNAPGREQDEMTKTSNEEKSNGPYRLYHGVLRNQHRSR